MPSDINALASDLQQAGANSLSSRFAHEYLNSYLTVRDHEDAVRPHLAADLPSLEADTWKVLDGGRMEVTWRLRPGATWHDGTEITSHDVRFAWQVGNEPAALVNGRGLARFVDRLDTPDPHTFVLHWKQPSYLGGELGEGHFTVLPRHLLEAAFQASPEGLQTNPYFSTTESFVGSGPYRAHEWERDSHLTVEAFDGYFLGRPRIDRVTFRFIGDSRTALANVLAGTIDVSYRSVELTEARIVKEEWARTNGGTVLMQPDSFRHLRPQFRADQANPRDLLNPEVRRALFHAVNRDDIATAAIPGAELVVDTSAVPGTRSGDTVDPYAVRYPFDPRRAAALLDEAGWRRDRDGVLAKEGERFRLELRSSRDAQVDALFPVLQLQYRQVGIELSYVEARAADRSAQVLYPGLNYNGGVANSPAFGEQFHTRNTARPENRFVGNNDSSYSNPEFDRWQDELNRSARFEDVLRNWGEGWRVLSQDVATIPLFIRPSPYIVRTGIQGALPTSPAGSRVWQLHSWDVL